MDAVKFLKERDRICGSYKYEGCNGCPLDQRHNDDYCNLTYCKYPEAFPEEAIAIVEKWSAEHPVKKYRVRFDGYVDIEKNNAEEAYCVVKSKFDKLDEESRGKDGISVIDVYDFAAEELE